MRLTAAFGPLEAHGLDFRTARPHGAAMTRRDAEAELATRHSWVARLKDALGEVSAGAWVLVGVLTLVAAAALVTLITTWSNEVEQEAGRTALSVLAVSVVGTVVTVGLDQYRQNQDERDRLREEGRKEAADERSLRHEANRREVEQLRDDRHRQDVQLRSLLQETIRTYNEVKRARRILKAHTGREQGRAITLDVYDTGMQELIRLQLKFEEFKRTTAVKPDSLGVAGTSGRFEIIEKYLNKVIDEYLESRHLLPAHDEYSLARLPRLSGFLHNKLRDDGGEEIGFNPPVADQMDDLIGEIQGALLEPLNLPSVRLGRSSAKSMGSGTRGQA